MGFLSAHTQDSFGLELKETNISSLPALQSFSWGRDGNKIIVFGGRTDGLHRRRPFEAFLASGNNTAIHLIDLDNSQVKTANLSVLNTSLNEQLQSTNMNYEQVGDLLYITGGYAYSTTAAKHITFDELTIVDVPGLISAIEQNAAIDTYFSQISDTLFQVTGGYLDYIDSEFYLVGGQNFEGQYNPMGPNHGPGFTQTYSEEIRRFQIQENAGVYSLANVKKFNDPTVLHRRDYNLAPQIFPNGEVGLTAFSGVFQLTADVPWLDMVDIHSDTFFLRSGNRQLLNQYQTAHTVFYDDTKKHNHSIFFGGIGQFFPDQNGNLVEDIAVPFVKTISQISRDEKDSTSELSYSLQMPAYLGAGAEFIPIADTNIWDEYDILHLDEVPASKVLIGYIMGGIESSAPNVFFDNASNTSWASTKLYEVYLDKSTTGQEKWNLINAPSDLNFDLYPNPAYKELNLEIKLPEGAEKASLRLLNIDGSAVLFEQEIDSVAERVDLDVSAYSRGIYLVELSAAGQRAVQKLRIR